MNRQMGKQTTPVNSIAHYQWARVCNCPLDWYGQYWWPQFPFMVIFATHRLTLPCAYQILLHYLFLPLGTIINMLTLQTHRKINGHFFQIKFLCLQDLSKANDLIGFSIYFMYQNLKIMAGVSPYPGLPMICPCSLR